MEPEFEPIWMAVKGVRSGELRVVIHVIKDGVVVQIDHQEKTDDSGDPNVTRLVPYRSMTMKFACESFSC
jgi:hypothetical protein